MNSTTYKLHLKSLKRLFHTVIILILSVALASAQTTKTKKHVVTGYVGGFRGLVDTNLIDAQKLTHNIYAFVNCRDSIAVLTNLKTDSINFRNLNKLKLINPT